MTLIADLGVRAAVGTRGVTLVAFAFEVDVLTELTEAQANTGSVFVYCLHLRAIIIDVYPVIWPSKLLGIAWS